MLPKLFPTHITAANDDRGKTTYMPEDDEVDETKAGRPHISTPRRSGSPAGPRKYPDARARGTRTAWPNIRDWPRQCQCQSSYHTRYVHAQPPGTVSPPLAIVSRNPLDLTATLPCFQASTAAAGRYGCGKPLPLELPISL
ncbi:hypothetical protein EVG20_g4329 [Dentipellis fragilis]|uniref:Uncharacterized protein n=1 Tax=Dentipellis fragilis TaxID=205917 RepID=A0A4Y9YYL3_9AGAM|nr:hypothetical protein EVG20_g4329 [Dentipellis fragilis]